ncbi:MAG: glycosyltransferase family 4 protein [Haliscomenobacter sp.]|nr:glycosyltransferase family 4 protein [Haliscomenobacter sp.]
MKILHLFPEYLPLTMIWAFQQIRHIPGAEAHMAGLSYLPDSYHDPAFRYWPNPKYRFPRILQNGVHIVLRKTRGFDYALADYIRKEGINLLHGHFGHIGADYAGLGKRLGIPVVVSFYGFDYGRILSEKPRYRKAYLRMFRQAGAVTCEGPFAVGQLEALGCPLSRIRQIPLGVDTSVIPVFRRKKEAGQLRLVQVATVTPRKGHLLGLDALEKALGSGLDITLDLYGPVEDVNLASAIRRRIAEGALAGKVRLLEPVPYSRLHALLGALRCFFNPACLPCWRLRRGRLSRCWTRRRPGCP